MICESQVVPTGQFHGRVRTWVKSCVDRHAQADQERRGDASGSHLTATAPTATALPFIRSTTCSEMSEPAANLKDFRPAGSYAAVCAYRNRAMDTALTAAYKEHTARSGPHRIALASMTTDSGAVWCRNGTQAVGGSCFSPDRVHLPF